MRRSSRPTSPSVLLRLGMACLVGVLGAGCASGRSPSDERSTRAGPTSTKTPPTASRELWVSPAGNDASPGSRARPLREVARAARLVTPGSVVHVAPGTYQAVRSSNGGHPGAPVVFRSERPGAARIEAHGAVTAWRISADWVTLQGFSLSGARWNGILTIASHGRFEHNHVHDIRAPSCARGGAGIVVESYTAVDNDTTGNLVDDVRAPGDCGLLHGIYYQSPHGGRITNNVVASTSGWGIHLWHNARDITIANNTVVDNAQGGIAVGGSLEGNDRRPGRATDVTVTNNVVVDNGGAGIAELGRVGRNTYVDNLTFGNAEGGYGLAHGRLPSQRVEAEPRFVDARTGDFRLQAESPGVDAGTALGAPSLDRNGVPRPRGRAVDVGAYEAAS